MKKRFIAFSLALSLCFSMLGMLGAAAEGDEVITEFGSSAAEAGSENTEAAAIDASAAEAPVPLTEADTEEPAPLTEAETGEAELPAATEAPAPIADAEEAVTSYDIHFSCVLDGWPRKGYANFNIYSEDGAMLDSKTLYIENTDSFTLNFSVPPSEVGTVFYLEATGLDSIDYYSDNYILPSEEFIPLYTYWSEPDENGSRKPVCDAYMTAHMMTQPPINIYVDGRYVNLSSPAIFEDSSIIAPLSEVAEAIGISDCTYYPEYNSVKVRTGNYEMLVNIGFSYVTVFGQDKNLNLPVSNINSLTYIELRPFVESFGCTLDYADSGEYIDINLNKSPLALESAASLESRINESGIGSSTNYLIWINKSEFRLSVFEGSAGNWKWIKDFTVGIGASSSETITGVFEYLYYVDMWPYASYYVGPVMVFYGNYAIHSTFLKYDGTPYNNNVGMKISLGCVRCQAKYINWLTDNMPLSTRIYVTEN